MNTCEFNNYILPEFTVNYETGFLPRHDPLERLPEKFDIINQILDEMPLIKDNGEKGLLAKGTLGSTILEKLPIFFEKEEIPENSRLLAALFRDYTFLASAFLLEPCHLNFLENGNYGLGRDYLPVSIALPLIKISEKLKCYPFMEYAMSYALMNWTKIDPNGDIEYNNLKLIRKFSNCFSERGFIITHVTMVKYTGKFIEAIENFIKTKKNAMEIFKTIELINSEMSTMWKKSYPNDYLGFRTFIFGIKNQPMFPNGVKYMLSSDNYVIYKFSGESGANDSIIPCLDNFLELTSKFPENEFTNALREFRLYRPYNHIIYLNQLQKNCLGFRQSFLDCKYGNENTYAYILLLDQVRDFRLRHWNFIKRYIVEKTKHTVATGGTNIYFWTGNQLMTVLNTLINDVYYITNNNSFENYEQINNILKNSIEQKENLKNELNNFKNTIL